jgi:hypothetical protein
MTGARTIVGSERPCSGVWFAPCSLRSTEDASRCLISCDTLPTRPIHRSCDSVSHAGNGSTTGSMSRRRDRALKIELTQGPE